MRRSEARIALAVLRGWRHPWEPWEKREGEGVASSRREGCHVSREDVKVRVGVMRMCVRVCVSARVCCVCGCMCV
jgi:hypothetical protein